VLGREMLRSLNRGLGLCRTRTISADEQSEDARWGLGLFFVGVRVIQHILPPGRVSIGRWPVGY
jgi:hypothetical protein